MQLQSFLPLPEGPTPGPLLGGSSPLRADLFRGALEEHPDRQYRDYIPNGLAEGFRVGFDRRQQLRSATHNLPSVSEHDSVVSSYIDTELSANRLLGPLPSRIARYTHRSRIGVIPKGHNTGKWRLITDLSFPPGSSVNDGISSALCSLSYISVDTVAAVITSLGQGTLLAKIDVQAAYRLIPVHPDNRPLLGIEWKGNVYCDAMLPFGLRSAAKIFSAVADALEWILRRKGVVHLLYHPRHSPFLAMRRQLEDSCGHVRRIGRSPSSRQMRRPQYLPYVPVNRVRYRDTDPSSAKGQTSQDPGHSRDVAR